MDTLGYLIVIGVMTALAFVCGFVIGRALLRNTVRQDVVDAIVYTMMEYSVQGEWTVSVRCPVCSCGISRLSSEALTQELRHHLELHESFISRSM